MTLTLFQDGDATSVIVRLAGRTRTATGAITVRIRDAAGSRWLTPGGWRQQDQLIEIAGIQTKDGNVDIRLGADLLDYCEPREVLEISVPELNATGRLRLPQGLKSRVRRSGEARIVDGMSGTRPINDVTNTIRNPTHSGPTGPTLGSTVTQVSPVVEGQTSDAPPSSTQGAATTGTEIQPSTAQPVAPVAKLPSRPREAVLRYGPWALCGLILVGVLAGTYTYVNRERTWATAQKETERILKESNDLRERHAQRQKEIGEQIEVGVRAIRQNAEEIMKTVGTPHEPLQRAQANWEAQQAKFGRD